MVESWLGSVLYVVAASRDELGQLSSVSWSSSPPLNTENMLEVSTLTEVLLLLTGNSGAMVLVFLLRQVFVAWLGRS